MSFALILHLLNLYMKMTNSLAFNYSFVLSFLHSFISAFIHPSTPFSLPSLIHAFIYSFNQSIQPINQSIKQSIKQSVIHSIGLITQRCYRLSLSALASLIGPGFCPGHDNESTLYQVLKNDFVYVHYRSRDTLTLATYGRNLSYVERIQDL